MFCILCSEVLGVGFCIALPGSWLAPVSIPPAVPPALLTCAEPDPEQTAQVLSQAEGDWALWWQRAVGSAEASGKI